MKIDVQIDTTEMLLRLRNGEKRLAYAAVNAINKTAERIQQAEFAREAKAFIIRKREFFFGSAGRPGGVGAKLKKASVGKARPFAEVFIGETSKGAELLLPTFEAGGTRRPMRGSKHIAVPVLGSPARPSIAGPIPPAFSFPGLKLRKFVRGRKVRRRRRGRTVDETVFQEFGRLNRSALSAPQAGVQWKGEQRTYMIPGVGVFQRFGRGQTRPLYFFADPFPIDARLEFVRTAVEVANAWFKEELQRETIEAITRVRS